MKYYYWILMCVCVWSHNISSYNTYFTFRIAVTDAQDLLERLFVPNAKDEGGRIHSLLIKKYQVRTYNGLCSELIFTNGIPKWVCDHHWSELFDTNESCPNDSLHRLPVSQLIPLLFGALKYQEDDLLDFPGILLEFVLHLMGNIDRNE